jgi:phospholipase/lecithinase/hemolysin
MSVINQKTLGLASDASFINSTLDGLNGNGIDPFAATSGSGSAAATASPFSTIYAFGDSLSDGGNISVLSLRLVPANPYQGGVFSNGPIWVSDIASRYGLPLPKASLAGGNDYAFGGAETGAEPSHAANAADLPSQFSQFTTFTPKPQANALYTLSIGGNDVLDAISAFSTDQATGLADISAAVANETSFITNLASKGAQNFLVMNVPDLSKTPLALSQGAQYETVASGLSALYDYQLNVSLANLATTQGLNIHVLDAYSLIDAGVANPAAFGLTNVTQPLWTGNYEDSSSGTLAATGAAQAGYLFMDNLHPTASGHILLANAGIAALTPA